MTSYLTKAKKNCAYQKHCVPTGISNGNVHQILFLKKPNPLANPGDEISLLSFKDSKVRYFNKV